MTIITPEKYVSFLYEMAKSILMKLEFGCSTIKYKDECLAAELTKSLMWKVKV